MAKETSIYLQLFANEPEEDSVEDINFEEQEQEPTPPTEEEPIKEEPTVENEPTEEDKKERNRQAYLRRKQKQEEELKKATKEAYFKGVLTSTKGENPFTNTKIVDDYDLKVYETMLEMEKQGLDPTDVSEYANFTNRKLREELQQQEQEKAKENELNQRLLKEIEDFDTKYGVDTREKIFNDKKFDDFSNGLVNTAPTLTTLYEKYVAMEEEINKRVEERVLQELAKQKSSAGGSSNNVSVRKSISEMTDEEYREFKKSLHKD